jgi:uncharacterized protein with FMN-binding domain
MHVISVVSVMGGFLVMLIILLRRNMDLFTGTEIVSDKIVLTIFNTAIIYGAIIMVVTSFVYGMFTGWGFFKYKFLIIKWLLMICIFGVAWGFVGSAISGMASISDAGLHMGGMKETYMGYWSQAKWSLITELILMLLAMVVSIRKPFGKRETKPFKHRKVVMISIALCFIMGLVMTVQAEIRHVKLRNTPIENIDVTQVADGEYEGTSEFGHYTYHVKVTVENHQITDIEDLAPRDSIYVTYATGVFQRIIDQQTPDVDAISGATTTSKAFMKAVENALRHGK